MKRHHIAVAAVALCLATLAAPASGQKVTFKMWRTPGRYEVTMDMKTDQTIMAQGMAQPAQKIAQLMVMVIDVAKPGPSGDRQVTMTFHRIRQSMEMGAMKMVFDSADKPENQNPMMGKMFAPMLKAKFVITVGPEGKVKKVQGLDELWGGMVKQNPAMAGMAKQMKQQFGDSMIKGLMGQGMQGLPDKPVAVGETWKPTTKLSMPFVGQADMRQVCTLKSLMRTPTGQVAVIDYTGTVQSADGAPTTMGPMTMTIKKLNLKQSGTMRFNTTTGMFETQTIKQTAEISMVSSGQGEAVSVELKQNMATTTKARKLAPGEQPTTKPAS